VRASFKTNTFDVVYRGEFATVEKQLNHGFEILSHKEDDWINSLTIKHSGGNNNELLQLITPHVEIVSFSERIPSMNEVFIRVVENNK
jgi:ABC-2 type transport system ATP-binding protein